MPNLIAHKKFVCTSAEDNNNKFWEYFQYDDGTVMTKYGRVGKTCQQDGPKPMTQRALEKKIQEKVSGRGTLGSPGYKSPYREVAVIAEGDGSVQTSAKSVKVEVLKAAATSQLTNNNPELEELILKLVKANKYELFQVSGGKLDIDIETGIISTPVGVVTSETVTEARKVFMELKPFIMNKKFDEKRFVSLINDYLMLVPQVVGHARGWHKEFFAPDGSIQKQLTLLDQLEVSADMVKTEVKKVDNKPIETPEIFKSKIALLKDKKTISRLEKFYYGTKDSRHSCNNLKPVWFYTVEMEDTKKAFKNYGAKLSNIWELWHGTRVFNILSILKSGLKLPKTIAGGHITGAMFGDGIYGTDQSTKALNYSFGYWDGGARDHNCFMFVGDFAMGKYFIPINNDRYQAFPRQGYDSTYAKGGVSGVLNNEMIVYKTEQVNLKYLVEFER